MSILNAIPYSNNRSDSYYARLLIKDHLGIIKNKSRTIILDPAIARRNQHNHRGALKELGIKSKYFNIVLLLNNLKVTDKLLECRELLLPDESQIETLLNKVRT